MAELSQCLLSFSAFDGTSSNRFTPVSPAKVTTFTSSDFGRTFPTNGVGSDHGWGSHHLIMGGGSRGDKTYGKFLTLHVAAADDTSTGR